jgi:hypothetical protein
MKVKPIGDPYQGRQTYAFLCPGCALYDAPGSRLYAVHTFRDGPDGWEYNGDGDEPTVRPSILVTGAHPSHRCHSFITRGQIVFQGDCSHPLKDQTVELADCDHLT